MIAAVRPVHNGSRGVDIEARQVFRPTICSWRRLADGNLQANIPVSASVHGEIGADGVPRGLAGRIVAEAGSIGNTEDGDGRIDIDKAEFKFNWERSGRRARGAVPDRIRRQPVHADRRRSKRRHRAAVTGCSS